jgi:LytS/YehU family sensor histidine kinase
LIGVTAYACIVAVITAIDERAARRRRELDSARLEADLAHAQMRALQMQLQPHFLFNTLHGIAMLTDTDPAAAESMAVKLAELLRATLRLRDVPEVPLRDELDLLRLYLEIEEARFGDRLAVTFVAPDDVLETPVPSFLLQPIVENAVRYGVAPRVETGHIAITAAREQDALVLSVEDDGPGFAADPFAAEGVGLAATRERLALRYGDASSIRCEAPSAGTHGARVAIRIPLDGTRPV